MQDVPLELELFRELERAELRRIESKQPAPLRTRPPTVPSGR